ncbi:hypothetical protein UFOVP40_21 [uncultured Caudovirales phage]|uniref:Uncharacterized protein n=1 Tax=uncultured Caudovirales phage TaxID=2100421 RepID=A0A6J5KSY6_9CAUD|nr:hypothetical protein UFOVP40_21 [uncultured Caudovirales phage]
MATAKKNASRKTAPAVAVAGAGEATLENVVEATKAGSFVYTSVSVHGPLIEAGLVEVNPAIANEAGEIATRATQKGIEMTATSTQETAAVETAAAAPVTASGGFAIEAGVPMPSISGRGRTGTTYPFDKMEAGHSFFVPNSEDKPNAAKSLASTVSSATARYAVPAADGSTKANKAGEQVPVMVETRKFVVRSVEENGVKGARVWRTA